jgi:ATP-dependent RNA helicase DBP3
LQLCGVPVPCRLVQEKKEKEEKEADAGGGDAEEPKKKKKKKKKKSEEAAEDAGDAPAAVVQPFNLYNMHEETRSLTSKEIQKFYEEKEISIMGPPIKPILTFERANFHKDVLATCKDFKIPTPIQAQCWPVLLSGNDVIGIAATGSGKTLTFGLPGMTHLKAVMAKKSSANRKGPLMLVLAPTRELAMQSEVVLKAAGALCSPPVRSICVYGGVPKYEQRLALRPKQGLPVEIVVATPGRLKDLMEEGVCNLSECSYLVLDEADRMLDQGFEKEVRAIIAACAEGQGRQTAMFSATWPKEVEAIANDFMRMDSLVKVTIGSDDLAASKSITQYVDVVDENNRDQLLLGLLKKYHAKDEKMLVFGLYKKECARLEKFLQQKGYSCCSIHGDKTQDARQDALAAFKTGKVNLMIATDVAARGLDIPKVEYVLNYSFPLTIEDYVHRIGRTGRAGRKGISHTFFSVGDKAHAGELVVVLRDANMPVPEELLKFGTHVKVKEHKLYGAFGPKKGMEGMKATKITFDNDSD